MKKVLQRIDSVIESAINQLFPNDLRIRYVMGLSAIALVIGIAHGLIQISLMNQRSEFEKIRSLDRYVVVLEQLGKTFTWLRLNGDRGEVTQDIKQIISKIKIVEGELAELIKEWPAPSFHTVHQFEARDDIVSAHKRIGKLLDLSQEIEREAERSEKGIETTLQERLTPLIESLESENVLLLTSLLSSLKSLEMSLSQRMYDFRWKEFYLLIVIFSILLFDGLYVFRPGIRRLYHALSVRSEFLSRLGHEIRNPLNAILGMTNMLIGSSIDEGQRQLLQRQKTASESLLELLNNLLDVAEIEAYKVHLESVRYDLLALVDGIVDAYSYKVSQKGLDFKVSVDPRLPVVFQGDGLKLKQVLMNIIGNAIKFTEEGMVLLDIRVVEEGENPRIRFLVQDTGVGIDSKSINAIFDSFVQEDSSIRRRYGGSGLGLYISNNFVNLMGGRLFVSSQKGEGTVFWFELTLRKVEGSIAESVAQNLAEFKDVFVYGSNLYQLAIEQGLGDAFHIQPIQSLSEVANYSQDLGLLLVDDSMLEDLSMFNKGNLKVAVVMDLYSTNVLQTNRFAIDRVLSKPFRSWTLLKLHEDSSKKVSKVKSDRPTDLRVLVVDDSVDNRLVLRSILEELGCLVFEVSSGEAAIEFLKIKQIDAIFMDLQMPGLDGYETTQLLRQAGVKAPFVAVTAHNTEKERRKVKATGFMAHVIKPIGLEVMQQVLQDLYLKIKKEVPMAALSPMARVEEKIKKMLPKYIKNREADLQKITEAFKAGQLEDIQMIGHRIKGNATSFGFPELSELAARIEVAARDGGDLKLLITELELMIQSITQAKAE